MLQALYIEHTVYLQGLRLWGGENFEAAGRFMHPNVRMVCFSPDERYLVTTTWADPREKVDENAKAVIIWDVRTGEEKRAFKNEGAKDKPVEPFMWSHDGKYFAKLAEDAIQVEFRNPKPKTQNQKPDSRKRHRFEEQKPAWRQAWEEGTLHPTPYKHFISFLPCPALISPDACEPSVAHCKLLHTHSTRSPKPGIPQPPNPEAPSTKPKETSAEA